MGKYGTKKTHSKGHTAENSANNALYTLKVRKRILGYRRATQGDFMDRNGIDFQCYQLATCGTRLRHVNLQVKSSDIHVAKHHQRYPGVRVWVIGARRHADDVVSDLLLLLRDTASRSLYASCSIQRPSDPKPRSLRGRV